MIEVILIWQNAKEVQFDWVIWDLYHSEWGQDVASVSFLSDSCKKFPRNNSDCEQASGERKIMAKLEEFMIQSPIPPRNLTIWKFVFHLAPRTYGNFCGNLTREFSYDDWTKGGPMWKLVTKNSYIFSRPRATKVNWKWFKEKFDI